MNKGFLISMFFFLFLSLGISQETLWASTKHGVHTDRERIKHLDWEGLELVWLQDQRFPTYDLSIYFADGAMSDDPSLPGETELMFQLLESGTNRYNQKQISDALEFYGVSLGVNVSHEYSLLTLSGLVKDMVPTLKMVCHLFKDSIYPAGELSKETERRKSSLLNIVSSPSALADRAFRQLSLKGTAYESSTDGTLQSLQKFRSHHLIKKLDYFKTKVKKRLYLSGPPNAEFAKGILLKECGWDMANSTFVRRHKETLTPLKKGPSLYLIPVPKANQAQIRIGRFLGGNEIKNPDLMAVVSGFLGGGFTSLLMQELRVKRGLTYSVGAVASPQRDYGRLIVTTFTKNETLSETLQVIQQTLSNFGQGKFPSEDLKKSVDYLSGKYLFGFEKNSAYLGNLLFFDHVQRSYEELYEFPQKIKKFKKMDVAKKAHELFNWDHQSIIILGDKSLLEPLKKWGEVKVISYQDLL